MDKQANQDQQQQQQQQNEQHQFQDPSTPSLATIRTLFGSTVSSCYRLRDLGSDFGFFFFFPDLCIRVEGVYRLRFTVTRVSGYVARCPDAMHSSALATVVSEPFRSYNPREFPGMRESSELVHHFFRQGVPLPVRTKLRNRK
ncbi:velvet factor [Entophlyctis helioformis]|nr:velvet factor [Entophlyctis helioformis]